MLFDSHAHLNNGELTEEEKTGLGLRDRGIAAGLCHERGLRSGQLAAGGGAG